MDEATKQVFKGKFIVLTVILNIIILCVAMGAFILFRYSSSTTAIAIAVVLLAIALVSSLSFRKRYGATKLWLDEHA
ncbi:hypothetical protein ABH15_00755 [Methanoculleus taiwanensis]|uniref:Uncharacterized protein n=1 Tax=Methanoculleus taiwanensis TaxID=1550565 RepID=A0A498H4S2_9EURY|nr:hypothetical protein [Methanoculleus taiwanensis]RXE57407.1 hypothetical protein ABH15_00755 [Methanoculleus taiwanensis]